MILRTPYLLPYNLCLCTGWHAFSTEISFLAIDHLAIHLQMYVHVLLLYSISCMTMTNGCCPRKHMPTCIIRTPAKICPGTSQPGPTGNHPPASAPTPRELPKVDCWSFRIYSPRACAIGCFSLLQSSPLTHPSSRLSQVICPATALIRRLPEQSSFLASITPTGMPFVLFSASALRQPLMAQS